MSQICGIGLIFFPLRRVLFKKEPPEEESEKNNLVAGIGRSSGRYLCRSNDLHSYVCIQDVGPQRIWNAIDRKRGGLAWFNRAKHESNQNPALTFTSRIKKLSNSPSTFCNNETGHKLALYRKPISNESEGNASITNSERRGF